MARPVNIVDQAINLMEKIEKTRQTAIKELLTLRGKIDTQLAQLGFGGTTSPAVAGKGKRVKALAAPPPKRVVSEETRKKMLKAQQERRKRENQAKLEAVKSQKKRSKVKKSTAKGVKTQALTEASAEV